MGIVKNSQRRQAINLQAGLVSTINFSDTNPQIFQIRNNGSSPIYLSPYATLNSVQFEISILPQNTRVYVNPLGGQDLSFYCAVDCSVEILSWECLEISPSDLDRTVVTGNVNTPNVNINNPLPSGTNHIGIVSLDNVSLTVTSPLAVTMSLPLPVGSNNIGKVDINSLPVNNFTPIKVTLAPGVDNVIKSSSGYVSKIHTSLTDCLLKNGATEVWSGECDFSNAILLGTSIILNSATGGVAYISYQ